jgi:hypothetical protein
VAIYSGDSLPGEAKRLIATEFENQIFDLADTKEFQGNDEKATRDVLAFAQSLRLPELPNNQERVN